MEYQAIARKWRPHGFEDLAGQIHVVQTLKNAILYNRVSHAYLFSGARGVGKTSVARIFAKTLRCPNVKDASPCHQCEECLLISQSRSVDVVEIDGASNNGVEAVREIRENVAYGASSGTYKIYIIDEVHMLSISAFNALLKTLEEPPPHVIFIMATTEPQKIPLTILSRCQKFEFRRLSVKEITENLTKVLSSEKLEIEEEALRVIATHADGSLRDAQSLLDQVLSYYSGIEGKISDTQVVEALGVSSTSSVRQLLVAILGKNNADILETIRDVYFSGVDLKHYSNRLLEEIRLLYLIALSIESKDSLSPEALDISKSHHAYLAELAKKTSVSHLERMSQILNRAISQISWATLPRFVLEMAAIRMSRLEALGQIESRLLNAPPVTPQAPVRAARTSPAPTQPHSVARSAAQPSSPTPPPPTEKNPPRESAPPPAPPPIEDSAPVNFQTSSPEETWRKLVEQIMKKRPILGALMSHGNFKLQQEENGVKTITLAFPEDSFYEKQIRDKKNRTDIEKILKDQFGPETVFVLSNELQDTHASLEKIRTNEEQSLKEEALDHPTVKSAKNLIGAEVITVNVSME